MNNDELKKKIVDIALHAEWTDMFGDHNSIGKYAANAIADALIAAWIGDVKDLQAQVDALEMTNIALLAGYDGAEKDRLYWVNKYKEAEQRAEVAEDELARHKRALRIAGDKFINEVCNMRGEDISDKCDYKCDTCFYDYYLQQAEKELAEENGGKK